LVAAWGWATAAELLLVSRPPTLGTVPPAGVPRPPGAWRGLNSRLDDAAGAVGTGPVASLPRVLIVSGVAAQIQRKLSSAGMSTVWIPAVIQARMRKWFGACVVGDFRWAKDGIGSVSQSNGRIARLRASRSVPSLAMRFALGGAGILPILRLTSGSSWQTPPAIHSMMCTCRSCPHSMSSQHGQRGRSHSHIPASAMTCLDLLPVKD
jgi:hypothetical protein